MIRNDEDAKGLLRGIDKHSDGWALIKDEVLPAGPERTQVWSAELCKGSGGIILIKVRQRGGKTIFPHWGTIPEHVKRYLRSTEPGGTALTVEKWEALTPGRHGILDVRSRGISKRVTFEVKHQPTRTARGILVGCEVGESGEGPTDFLPFPTTEREVLHVLDGCVAEARDMEVETGWANDGEDESSTL